MGGGVSERQQAQGSPPLSLCWWEGEQEWACRLWTVPRSLTILYFESGSIWFLVCISVCFHFVISVPWQWVSDLPLISVPLLLSPHQGLSLDSFHFSIFFSMSCVHFRCLGHLALSWSNRQRINENRWGQEIISPLKLCWPCQSCLNKCTGCWFKELVLKEDFWLQYRIYSVSGHLATHWIN